MNVEKRKLELDVILKKELKIDERILKDFRSKLTEEQLQQFNSLYKKHKCDRLAATDEFFRVTWDKGWFWIGEYGKHPAKSNKITAMYHTGGYIGVKRVVLLPTEELAKRVKEHEGTDLPIQKEIDLPSSIGRYWSISRFHTFEDCEKDQDWVHDTYDGVNTVIEVLGKNQRR